VATAHQGAALANDAVMSIVATGAVAPMPAKM
jgi:hypothetical protein